MDETPAQPPPLTPETDPTVEHPVERPRLRAALRPLAVAILGLALMTGTNRVITHDKDTTFWKDALVIRKGEAPWDSAIPLRARPITTDGRGLPPEFYDQLRVALSDDPDFTDRVKEAFETGIVEHLVSLELPRETWESLLADGRLPKPGKPEVLAGQLCRFDTITVGDRTFQVVGRLRRGARGFVFSYLIPADAAFDDVFDSDDAKSGFLELECIPKLEALNDDERESADWEIVQPHVPLTTGMGLLVALALALIVGGGSVAQARFLVWFSDRTRLFRGVVEPFRAWSGLFGWTRFTLYAIFIGFGLVAIAQPVLQLRLVSLVTYLFTEGDLAELGQAYTDGHIFTAAWRTWLNNYVDQTLKFTLLPGLIPVVGGVIGAVKTAFSLALAGFVLGPVWADMIPAFTFHSVTISLELEAYCIAVFVVLLYPVYLIRGLQEGKFAPAMKRSARLFLDGTLLTALLLFIAAFYEAVTLILLAG